MPQHSLDDYALALREEYELSDDLADVLYRYYRRATEAPTVYADADSDVRAVLARHEEAKKARL